MATASAHLRQITHQSKKNGPLPFKAHLPILFRRHENHRNRKAYD